MQTFLATDFLDSLGVNTHIGKVLSGIHTPYANPDAVIRAIEAIRAAQPAR